MPGNREREPIRSPLPHTSRRDLLDQSGKRFERIDIMRKRGKWKDGDRGLGIPKTKAD